MAIKNLDLLQFSGCKVLRRGLGVLKKERAAAPTSMLMKIAYVLSVGEPDVVELTALALAVHEYQHNGPDLSGAVSRVPDDETARGLSELLLRRVEERLPPEDKA
ncbi:MAG: hypothetical protein QW452_07205 [Pyrobaculum sp.]